MCLCATAPQRPSPTRGGQTASASVGRWFAPRHHTGRRPEAGDMAGDGHAASEAKARRSVQPGAGHRAATGRMAARRRRCAPPAARPSTDLGRFCRSASAASHTCPAPSRIDRPAKRASPRKLHFLAVTHTHIHASPAGRTHTAHTRAYVHPLLVSPLLRSPEAQLSPSPPPALLLSRRWHAVQPQQQPHSPRGRLGNSNEQDRTERTRPAPVYPS